jgi:hypothetical protein
MTETPGTGGGEETRAGIDGHLPGRDGLCRGAEVGGACVGSVHGGGGT